MENLTRDNKGVKLNSSNFRKLYKFYDAVTFKKELTRLCRANHYSVSNWHSLQPRDAPDIPDEAFDTFFVPLYKLTLPGKGWSIVDYQISPIAANDLQHKLGFQNNTELIKYLVEEFILDLLYIINKTTYPNLDHATFKQQINNLYFKHNIILPGYITKDDQHLLVGMPL